MPGWFPCRSVKTLVVCQMGVLGHFVPYDILGLGVLGHFSSKNQTRKIVTIHRSPEL